MEEWKNGIMEEWKSGRVENVDLHLAGSALHFALCALQNKTA
jgi:hypothetical protein